MRAVRRCFETLPPARYRALTADAFFVSPGFAALWRHRGGEPVVWCVEADGDTLAVLPGVEFRRGPLRRFVSMPDGCYGGVFSTAGTDHARCVRVLLRALVGRYAIVDVFDFHRSIPSAPGFVPRCCEARVVTLTGADWMPADPELVRQAEKARREGIVIERMDAARHLDGVMRLADKTARTHRCRQRYPRAFHEGLAALAERDDRVVWRYCERDGVPVNSQIYVVERGVLQAWQSYFDRAYSFLKPNPAMRLEVCREFAAQGGRTFNLGSTPATAHGLAAYKRRWGGRIVRYPDYAWNALLGARERVFGSLREVRAPAGSAESVPAVRHAGLKSR